MLQKNQEEDEIDCHAMLISICRADPQRALIALSRFFSNKDNADVKAVFGKMMAESNAQKNKQKSETEAFTTKLIVEGIRESIAFHTNDGTCPMASETFVKNVTHACLFKIVKEKIRSVTTKLATLLVSDDITFLSLPK